MIQELLHLIFEGIVILLVIVKEFNYRKMWGKPECFIAILFFWWLKKRRRRRKEKKETRKYRVIKLGREKNILFKNVLYPLLLSLLLYDDR